MRTIIQMIVAVLALTVIAPGYAKDESRAEQLSVTQHGINNVSEKIQTLVSSLNKPLMKFDPKEFTCLAKNIFFESANEPEEGKVAVGLVTLNRVSSGKFKDTVCGVVDQKLSRDIPTIKIVEKKVGFFGTTTETKTVWNKLTICQFSWRCVFVKNPKSQDERWVESQNIAKTLLADPGSYESWRVKYVDALYFHATSVRPSWARQKKTVERIGGHIFYAERI